MASFRLLWHIDMPAIMALNHFIERVPHDRIRKRNESFVPAAFGFGVCFHNQSRGQGVK